MKLLKFISWHNITMQLSKGVTVSVVPVYYAKIMLFTLCLVTSSSYISAAQCPCCIPDDGAELSLGDEVSLNAIQLIDGSTLDHSAISEERIAVLFWASWCPTCIRELSDTKELMDVFKRNNTFLVGMNMDFEPDQAIVFINDKKLPFPNSFISFEIVNQFKSIVILPKLVILDRTGTVLSISNPVSHQQIEDELLESNQLNI